MAGWSSLTRNRCTISVIQRAPALGEQPARLCAMMHHRNLTTPRYLFAEAV